MHDLYKIAYEARREESTRDWTVFSVMSSINGIMFVLIIKGDCNQKYSVLVPILGIVICIIWFLIQIRFKNWCKWWDDKLIKLEPYYIEQINKERESLSKPPLPADLRLFQEPKKQQCECTIKYLYKCIKSFFKLPWTGISTRWGGCFMALLFLIMWIVYIFYVM